MRARDGITYRKRYNSLRTSINRDLITSVVRSLGQQLVTIDPDLDPSDSVQSIFSIVIPQFDLCGLR
jgi:hypothetical protein